MSPTVAIAESPVATCPVTGQARVGLSAQTWLELPLHQRMIVQHGTSDNGSPELQLYYGTQEITFDDPAMFAFGETLAQQSRFQAGEALRWGHSYLWSEIGPLLQDLVDAGILRTLTDEEAAQAPQRPAGDEGARPSPLPPAPSTRARSWDEAETLMQELTGRALDPAYLEIVVPVFRVAHMALDTDGRQVGESNVFPPAMRLDVPTRWRTCIYAGTRHRSDRPMNVTALKAMRAHWPTMMAILLAMRRTYLRRCPQTAAGWTVGHLERLSTAVLGLPSYLLMCREGRVADGALHPALSSVFRVTDGLRLTLHQMLFVPLGEPTVSPDAPVTAEQVYAYAERNFSFHSDHGVCAGPQAMIEEFLSVIIDGREPAGGLPQTLDPEITAALAVREAALDYSLRGLQVHGVAFALWPWMARAYEAIADAVAALADAGSTAAQQDLPALQAHVKGLREASYLGQEGWRVDRDAVYADMVAQCERALTGGRAGVPLAERLAPLAESDGRAACTLAQALHRRYLPGTAPDAAEASAEALEALSHTTLAYLRRTRAVLRETTRLQQPINQMLQRPAPQRELTHADLDLHNRLQARTARRVPYLPDALEALWGLTILVTPSMLTVTTPSSTGMVPAGSRADARSNPEGKLS